MPNTLTLDEYQAGAEATFIVEKSKMEYLILGLLSESGEVADKFKKLIRDREGDINDLTYDDRVAVGKEIGDVLWYTAVLAAQLHFDMSSIAEMNLRKLDRRMQMDLIKGSGDDR